MKIIFDLHDKLKEEGYASPIDYYKRLPLKARGLFAYAGKSGQGAPVRAIIERGRWIAVCECGAGNWVAQDEPFWCFECGNKPTGGSLRPVEFPEFKAEIEAELLKRELVEMSGSTPIQKRINALPKVHKLGLEWRWGESVEDLAEQRENGL